MTRSVILALLACLLYAFAGCSGEPPPLDLGDDTDNSGDSDADGDGDSDSDSDADGDGDTDPPSSWTLMMYEDADNNLEDLLLQDVNEMELAQIPENVNIIVLLDRAQGYDTSDGNWTGAKLFRITHDENMAALGSERLADPTYLGLTADSPNGEELDMGSRDTLDKFIRFCQEAFPAEGYILHFSDHGDGWSKGPEGEPVRGTCADDSSGNMLSVSEDIVWAMQDKGIDAVTYDACLMGTVEVAWAMKDVADYMGASVMTIPGPGFEYTMTLDAWFQNMTAENWVRASVEKFMDFYSGDSSVGYTAVDLVELDAFGNALAAFLASAGQANVADMRSARDAAYKPDPWFGSSMIDFEDFVERAGQYVGDGTAEALVAAFDAAVIQYEYSNDLAQLNGLTVYSGKGPFWDPGYDQAYDSTIFAQQTGWDEFIKSLL